jgi:hypothetical protein
MVGSLHCDHSLISVDTQLRQSRACRELGRGIGDNSGSHGDVVPLFAERI